MSVQQVLPFKLVDGRNHRQHQLAGGCAGVQILFVADEMHFLGLQPLHDFEQVFGAACEAAKVVDVDGIALPYIVEHCLELGPVHALAADFFGEPLLDAVFLECFDLTSLVLFFGADADICDLHRCTSLDDRKIGSEMREIFEKNAKTDPKL